MLALLGAPVGDPTRGSFPPGPLQRRGRSTFPFGMNWRPKAYTKNGRGFEEEDSRDVEQDRRTSLSQD